MRADVAKAFLDIKKAGEPGTFTASYRFSPDLAVFSGHFPGDPIVPAVFEIEMVRHAAEAFSGIQYSLAEVKKAKISAPARPGDTITVEGRLSDGPAGAAVSATLRSDGELKASMTLTLHRVQGRPGA